jgi:hypothetical protein
VDVRGGDEVALDALRADLRRPQTAEVLHQDLAGLQRGGDRDLAR